MNSTSHYLYETWGNIKARCFNKRAHNYAYYGGRGITMIPEWSASQRNKDGNRGNGFKAFADWIEENLGPRPEGMTLDRIDNEGNYEPGNLRWATRQTQQLNKREDRGIAKYTVSFPSNKTNPWGTRVKRDGTLHYLGYYPTQLEAHEAGVAWAKEWDDKRRKNLSRLEPEGI